MSNNFQLSNTIARARTLSLTVPRRHHPRRWFSRARVGNIQMLSSDETLGVARELLCFHKSKYLRILRVLYMQVQWHAFAAH